MQKVAQEPPRMMFTQSQRTRSRNENVASRPCHSSQLHYQLRPGLLGSHEFKYRGANSKIEVFILKGQPLSGGRAQEGHQVGFKIVSCCSYLCRTQSQTAGVDP